jgi:hypothetical protein
MTFSPRCRGENVMPEIAVNAARTLQAKKHMLLNITAIAEQLPCRLCPIRTFPWLRRRKPVGRKG